MRRVLWAALAGLFILTLPALAQTGRIIGTVVDSGGAPVDGARVTLLQDGLCITNVTTNADGEFVFEAVDPGIYDLRVCKPRVGMATVEDIEVIDGQTTEVPPIELGGCGGGGGGGGQHGGTCPGGHNPPPIQRQ
jgi:hypothetical protein